MIGVGGTISGFSVVFVYYQASINTSCGQMTVGLAKDVADGVELKRHALRGLYVVILLRTWHTCTPPYKYCFAALDDHLCMIRRPPRGIDLRHVVWTIA